jgi:hypothetical protein
MYHISPQEFTEHVRLSDSWTALARRCGKQEKFGGVYTTNCGSALKQKVLSLGLDTQHFARKTRPDVTDADFRFFVCHSTKLAELMQKCNYCYSSKHARKYCLQRIKDMRLRTSHFKFKPKRNHTKQRTTTKLNLVDDESFCAFVSSSNSWFDVMEKCGYKHNFADQKAKCIRRAAELTVDSSHFTTRCGGVKKKAELVFVAGRKFHNVSLKHRLIHDLGWPYQCSKCKNAHFTLCDGVVMWMNEPVTLQLEHKNGNPTDNQIENLEFLCALCHSQSSTYGGKNTRHARAKRAWIADVAVAADQEDALQEEHAPAADGEDAPADNALEEDAPAADGDDDAPASPEPERPRLADRPASPVL